MSTMKNCYLCLNEYEESGFCSPKLLELCCKYLHSSLTQELLSSHSIENNVLLCRKCLEFVGELKGLNDQLEYFQNRISESIFIRSLEILHRRGNVLPNDQRRPNYIKSERQLIELDVTDLPNCDFRIIYSNVSDTVVKSEEVHHNFDNSEDICDDEFQDPLAFHPSDINNTVDVTFERIKVENNELSMIDKSQETKTIEDIDANLFIESTKHDSDDSTDHNDVCEIVNEVILTRNKKDNLRKLKAVPTKRRRTGSCKSTTDNKIRPSNSCSTSTVISVSSMDEQQSSVETSESNSANTFGDLVKCQLNQVGYKSFQGLLCDERFQTEEELDVRAVVKTEEPINICDGGEENLNEDLIDNDTPQTSEGPYECVICKKRFPMERQLWTHTANDKGNKLPLKCCICGVGYINHAALNLHKRIHSREGPYKCKVCGMGFMKKYDLKRHKSTHNVGPPRPFKCQVCGKAFVRKIALDCHTKLHNDYY